MLYSGIDPESYITEYTLVYEDNKRGVTEVPCCCVETFPLFNLCLGLWSCKQRLEGSASERRGNNTKGFYEFDLQAKVLTVLPVPDSLGSGSGSDPSSFFFLTLKPSVE